MSAMRYCELLNFPKEWSNEIESILSEIKASQEKSALFEDWSKKISAKDEQEKMVEIFRQDTCTLGIHNTMWALVCMMNCLDLVRQYYEKKGISNKIMLDTLKDFKIWTGQYFEQTGKVGLYESNWHTRHINCTIFRLGRLQFELLEIHTEVEDYIKDGDKLLSVHIPRDGRLDLGECLESFKQAKEFFTEYFPDFKYKGFLCYSWLLDTRLKMLLPEDSNIIKFQNEFNIIKLEDNINVPLAFVFKKIETDLDKYPQNSTLEKAIIRHLKSGGKLGVGIGFRYK